MKQTIHFLAVIFLSCLLGSIGCSADDKPELATVDGFVTLDGHPLEGATIEFAPEVGRHSTGTTNADGNYELYYIGTEKGAVIGKHRVMIYGPPNDGPNAKPTSVVIPDKYKTQSDLTAEVSSDTNTHNFELKSK